MMLHLRKKLIFEIKNEIFIHIVTKSKYELLFFNYLKINLELDQQNN